MTPLSPEQASIQNALGIIRQAVTRREIEPIVEHWATLENYLHTLEREHRAMQTAIKKAVTVIKAPNPAITDTIWAGDGQTLVDLLLSSTPAR